MSRMAAIDVAVRHQLAADGKPIEYRRVLGAAGLGYDEQSVQTFLLNVSNRLRMDVPPFRFDWSSIDPARCLNGDLMLLIGQIDTLLETGSNA